MDAHLQHALNYFRLGDELIKLLAGWAPESEAQELFPLRFLQYWKSVTAIIGDPSRTRGAQSKPRDLGLGRRFYQKEVRPYSG